jgi:hypothetical protein
VSKSPAKAATMRILLPPRLSRFIVAAIMPAALRRATPPLE